MQLFGLSTHFLVFGTVRTPFVAHPYAVFGVSLCFSWISVLDIYISRHCRTCFSKCL